MVVEENYDSKAKCSDDLIDRIILVDDEEGKKAKDDVA